MRRLPSIAGATLIAMVAGVALAEQDTDRSRDEKAIRAAVASFVAAFNKGDAKALAGHWIADGDLVTASGEMVKGRDAIQQQFEIFLAERGRPKLKSDIVSIRFLGADVAVEDAVSELDPPPAGPPIHAHHTTVFVKRGDKWLIASARGAVSFPPSNYEHLKELEWMIGRWSFDDPSSGEHIHTTCRWSENKNFIVREFQAELNHQIHVSGTTQIGWDPLQKTIKSWVFQNNGNVFQGTWTRDGRRWLVREEGTLRDESQVSAVNVITPLDENTFQFQSVERKRNGKPEPDVEPVQLSRQPDRR